MESIDIFNIDILFLTFSTLLYIIIYLLSRFIYPGFCLATFSKYMHGKNK